MRSTTFDLTKDKLGSNPLTLIVSRVNISCVVYLVNQLQRNMNNRLKKVWVDNYIVYMKSILSIVDSEGCERGVYTIADYLLHVFWSHMLNNLINLVVMTLLDQRVLKIKNQLQKSLPHHVLYSLFHIGGVGEGFRVWVYYPEVWGDNASRKAKSCLYYVCNWLCSFSLAMYAFKNNFENIIYATFCACTSLHVFSFIQKLKVILEEINQTWDEHITAWKSRPW